MSVASSLMRGLPRIGALLTLGLVLLLSAQYLPQILGPVGTPVSFGLGLTFVGLALGDLALRIAQPGVDATRAAQEAMRDGNTAAGLVYLGRCVLAGIILILMSTSSRAGVPPPAAIPLLPILKAQQLQFWPDMPMPSALGAQVEQETCISLKHRWCWNPRAELKTSREQGVGLGQLTRAFRANGSTRFDSLSELVDTHPEELRGLSWENRYDPTLQLRALVLKNLQGCRLVRQASTPVDWLAMCFAAYNGGLGGLNSDRRSCAGTPGCNPGKWFGHVERTSLKAKTAVPGYGKSFFEINREYVTNVLVTRRPRYLSLE